MDTFWESKDKECNGEDYVEPGSKDTQVQLVISLTLGLTAFFAFCILRPRWKTLYTARKRHLDPDVGLPTLPDSFFGWIPALYMVTEEQVLASAGLDAFVFLSFFKMAIRIFGSMFLFAAAVLEPINRHFVPDIIPPGNGTNSTASYLSTILRLPPPVPYHGAELPAAYRIDDSGDNPDNTWNYDMGYLWAYLIFTYFFTFLTMYFMNSETFKVIRIRQDYLGTQSTVTDRTFRLSGIPNDLRSEDKIKELVEKLEIGLVESVTLCRNWMELDKMVEDRSSILRKLEETWSVYLGQKTLQPVGEAPSRGNQVSVEGRVGAVDEESGENGRLLGRDTTAHLIAERERPVTRIWYGFLRLQSRRTDALDYYEEKLRRLDEKIRAARKKTYEPANLAFVTMDSIAACQMAIQALIDPRPGRLLTSPAPSPSDIIWTNTYKSRLSRKVRSWIITIFIVGLTIIWLVPVAFLASVLSLCTIRKAWPELATSLSRHEITKALVQTGLPTAVVSLLNVAVPYLYYYLSTYQGMLSQDHVELSAISKNFFFTFFNIFLVFTVFGTASKFIPVLRESLKDTTYLAVTLATSLQNLGVFYLNFIMLQGLGLFPFRLLEFGSVAMYPVSRMGAKTPRDYAEMVAPPVFSYGFYLPSALLVFILCLVYSALPRGFLVLFLGVVYFTLGYFTYKYQLLYAMDQPQHATGGAWPMICYRVILGLVVFQLTMSGVLALNSAFTEALLVVPLLLGTCWYSYYFRRQFQPLTKFISLRSIKRHGTHHYRDNGAADEHAVAEEGDERRDDSQERERERDRRLLRRGSTIDEDREKGLKFVNPSLIVPLEQPWIYHDPPPLIPEEPENGDEPAQGVYNTTGGTATAGAAGVSNAAGGVVADGSTSSEFSLGDTHVWRDGGGAGGE